jgi:membrane-bound lytic murein transglycosylase A
MLFGRPIVQSRKNLIPSALIPSAVIRSALASLAVLGLAGCQLPQAQTGAQAPSGFHPTRFATLPGWSAAQAQAGLRAFQRSCAALSVLPEDQKLGGANLGIPAINQAGAWRPACQAAKAVPPGNPAAAETFFTRYFAPYASNAATRLTGYFEPSFKGSEIPLAGYNFPVYGKPDDLVTINLGRFKPALKGQTLTGRLRLQKLVPYYSRAAINQGALNSGGHAVGWLRSASDAYLLQLQGVGRMRLPDGTLVDLVFDGTNGRQYTPIGKILAAKGDLPANDLSVQSIITWLQAHPHQATAIMNQNRNYVFFKRIKNIPHHLGAPGALGVPLTPRHSLAVAAGAIPLGAPVYVSAPGFARLTAAQDIDVDAKGADAAQIFFGIGAKAEATAGAFLQTGQIYVLLPRPISPSNAG